MWTDIPAGEGQAGLAEFKLWNKLCSVRCNLWSESTEECAAMLDIADNVDVAVLQLLARSLCNLRLSELSCREPSM